MLSFVFTVMIDYQVIYLIAGLILPALVDWLRLHLPWTFPPLEALVLSITVATAVVMPIYLFQTPVVGRSIGGFLGALGAVFMLSQIVYRSMRLLCEKKIDGKADSSG